MILMENDKMIILICLVLILLTVFIMIKIILDKFRNLNSKIDNIEKSVLENNKNIKLNNELLLNSSSYLKDIKEEDFVNLDKNIKLAISNIEKYVKSQDKNAINVGTKLDNYFINVTKIISTLKIDNLIGITNEVNKYRQGILEDEFFLQEVSHCKIVKFKDKRNNDFTKVSYNELGEKLYAETYSENKLKLLIKYQNDKIKEGIEFDKDGNEIFEYFYNEAEEISKKIEYEYDNDGKKIKEEINY
ncbi:hypothetical protein O8C99_09160 [Aliarcobacter butzleri]|uniref:hypothetical protein n=2 Tax=Aliarcobacter butzleri TaxID=28197 RepID=UPI00263F134F|nr:hypothetical protein [Aliarcobacter butzleri]MDN5103354.1 hypothetical protein [Aliarcobacter butzleri]